MAASLFTCPGKQHRAQATKQINLLAGTLGDWQNGNVNGVVNAIAVAPNGDVYVGGSFTMAGTTAALNVAKWNGTTWSALGAGLTYSVVALTVDSNGNVFTAGGTASTQRLDRWNGTSWSSTNFGATNSVNALAADQLGNVYAGGGFSTYFGAVGTGIAKWNGTAWSAMGAGPTNTVHALAFDNTGTLYAGGGGLGPYATGYVARWTGTLWQAVGNSLPSVVVSVAADGNGNVYAGHYPPSPYSGPNPTIGLAKWNGTSWQQVGNGPAPMAFALVVDSNNALYMGSSFASIDGVAARNVAKWSGTAWSAVGTGMSGQYSAQVNALALRGNMLYAGGWFATSGDGTRPLVNFAIYDLAAPLATAPAALARQVQLYPNPARQVATVEVPASLGQQPLAATLLDALGRPAPSHSPRRALPHTSSTCATYPRACTPCGWLPVRVLSAGNWCLSRKLRQSSEAPSPQKLEMPLWPITKGAFLIILGYLLSTAVPPLSGSGVKPMPSAWQNSSTAWCAPLYSSLLKSCTKM